MTTVSHVSHPINSELVAVATGHAGAPGQPFEITLTAYAVGKEDAELGEPYCPEMLYVKMQDIYDYSIGFLSVRPDCVPAEETALRFEQVQYEIAHGEEPAYRPVVLDFDPPF
jgi:hypothetical protein